MNAYQSKKTIAAAIALCAVLMSAPAGAQAMDTAALVPNQQAQQQTQEKMPTTSRRTSFRGVETSGEWLRQARISGMMLNLRVFNTNGSGVIFKEKLTSAQDGGICLYMRAHSNADSLMLQMDQKALDTLARVGITQVAVADVDGYVRMRYLVSELDAVRSALGLGAREQLGVSGENDPLTIVSEDGIRRRATN